MKTMKTMYEILQEDEFRKLLFSFQNKENPNYNRPDSIPPLYKYCKFSKYSVDNIVNNSISYSLITSFNDNFDSIISYGDVKKRAKEQHDANSALANQFGISYPISKQEWTEILIKEQNLHSDFLHDNYCLCLSENNSSVLMWSHYADNHKGICIEYDFESIKNNKLIYYSLFPVNYTAIPR